MGTQESGGEPQRGQPGPCGQQGRQHRQQLVRAKPSLAPLRFTAAGPPAWPSAWNAPIDPESQVCCPPACYPPFRDRGSRPELTVGCRARPGTWSSLNLLPPHCTHPEGRRWSHPSGVKELSHRDRIQRKRKAASAQDSFPQCALCWGEELGISSHRPSE